MIWLNSISINRNIITAWGFNNRLQVVAIGAGLIIGFILVASLGSQSKRASELSKDCQISAIFNFGDSNSDTGSKSAAFGRVPYPNAERLGLSYLSAYLNALEANFQHGADFAASGTTIQHVDGKLYGSGLNPLSLDVQLLQFEDLKERTNELFAQDNVKDRFPRPEDFSRALYTLDIGQNDIHHALTSMGEVEARKSIPELMNQFALAIKKLHDQGARTFWIHNTGPIGCLPYLLIKHPPKPENVDEAGCLKSYNEVAKEFNKQLKNKITELQTQLHTTLLVYVDIYSAKYSLISRSMEYGFVDPLGYCCKHANNSPLHCWNKDRVNKTAVYATPCSKPWEYISWDSIHYTEAANRWVANRVLDGSFSDPPIPLHRLCTKS